MIVLGVSAFFHDAAAALMVDGDLVAAAEEERFSRRKHDARLPRRAIDFCLRQAGIRPADVDHVAFYERPAVKLDRAVTTILAGVPHTAGPYREFLRTGRSRLPVRELLSDALGTPTDRILFVDHHLSHAASSFFASPFSDAATLTIDGVGEWVTTSIGEGHADWTGTRSNQLVLRQAMCFPHSIGLLYSAFTEFLGFDVNDGEYKLMGLAAYGRPTLRDELDRVAHRYPDGSVWLDMRYLRYHRSARTGFHRRLVDLLGVPPRHRNSDQDLVEDGQPSGPLAQRYADIAATIQSFTEETVVEMARHALSLTGQSRLCLAGGVALNGVANARVAERAGATELFIPPAPGDAGGALGAALYTQHVLLGRPRRFVMADAYWGSRFTGEHVAEVLRRHGVDFTRHSDRRRLVEKAAGLLAAGQVIGWFQGRFEFGPRALGNRSILADPRNAAMKDVINRKVKFREPFRPFAPAMLTERAGGYVDSPAVDQWPARFMLLVLPLDKEFARDAPAVDHFGTGRVQIVTPDANPLFHSLISAFQERTGLGCLLNTSFNLRGEPIVGSPTDALATFNRSGLDALVMEDCVVTRR